MKFSLSFLRDLVNTPLDAQQAGDLFTMTGFELEETFVSEGEDCLDINIMANRGDAASVLGLVREFHAKRPEDALTPLAHRLNEGSPRGDESATEIGGLTSVSIQTSNCTRYACRVFLDVQNGPSPEWLQKRLTQCGQRPISLLVDLANYVMLEMGQPLHAFDLDTLAGQQIIVRQAREGEAITTLDGAERTLNPSHMVIADQDRAVAVAGVMGGQDTEVSAATKRCLLESAHFDSLSIRRTRKALGLNTEASWRFERCVDPQGVAAALNRFADLYESITQGEPVPGLIDVFPSPPVRTPVSVTISKINRLLGMDLEPAYAADCLRRLGFSVEESNGEIQATPPSWRTDVLLAEDLVEEVGRVHGYQHFRDLNPPGSTPMGGVHGLEEASDAAVQIALRAGLNQALTHSLGDLHPLDAPGDKIRVRSPHSPEMAWLRNSLMPGLAAVALRNGGRNQSWFEAGSVFLPDAEEKRLGILLTGSSEAVHPSLKPNTADFFVMKGAVEAVLRAMKVEGQPVASDQDHRLHPTRQAVMQSPSEDAFAVFGQIHPDLADQVGLPRETYLAEVRLASAYGQAAKTTAASRPISRNPAATRDIAVVASKSLPYAQLEEAIASAGGAELEDFRLFDIYEGKGVPEGSHSLAFALQFRKMGSNFTDEEANQARDRILAELAVLGATQRQ